MAKKRKYEDLSAKEREEMEMEGVKRSGVDVSIIDAGKKEFKRRQKAQPKDISAKKAAKQEIREFKKTGELPAFGEKPATEPKLKAVTDATGVETITHQTYSNPLAQPSGEGIVQPSNIIGTNVYGKSPTVDGNEKIELKAVTDVIDGNRAGNMNAYDQDIDAMSNLDEAVNMEVEGVKDSKKLLDYITEDDTDISPEIVTESFLTTDDIINESDAAIYDYAQGDPDIYAKAKEYRDQLKGAKINAREPAIEKMGVQQYYPDLNRPLRVGSYSGSIIGTSDIYVAGGGRMPIGIIDARKRALEKAGKEKAANKRKILEMAYAKGAVPIQHQVDDMSSDLIEKYMDLTGGDFSMLTDPSSALGREWFKEVNELQTFATRTKMTDNLVKQMMKDELDEKKHVPKFARKLQSMWNSGALSMSDFKKDKRKFNELEQGVQTYTSATHVLEKYKDLKLDKVPMRTDIDWNSKETANSINQAITKLKSPNYDNIYTISREFMDLKSIEEIVDTELDQNKIYLGLNEKERVSRRQGYIDYTMSLFADRLTERLTNIVTKQGQFREKMAFQKKKYADSKTTLLTNIVDGDRSIANEKSKLDLERSSALLNQGITEPNDVRRDYTSHMGFEAVIDPDNPNRLAGSVPLTNEQKKNKFDVPASSASYMIGRKLYNYNDAVRLAVNARKDYASNSEFESDHPELAGMINLNPDQKLSIKINSAEHSYGINREGERVELGMDDFGENREDAFNMYTENYSSSYETEEELAGEKGKVSVYVAGGEERGSRAEAQEIADELNAEAKEKGLPQDASVYTKTATKKKSYSTPQVVYRYNIDNKNENALAGSSLTKATKDLNLVDPDVPGSRVEESSVSYPAGSDISNLYSE